MQIINNSTGLFENIYFKNTVIDESIKNHKELFEIIIPQCSKLLVASPFLMDDFKPFFKDINIQNIEFELITTCKPQGYEQLVKPFQIKNFGLTIEKFSSKYPTMHLINNLHSKIYLFYIDGSRVLGIVTSANFTNSGLTNNHETGVILSDTKILESLELDIRDNLEYINLTKKQIDDLCSKADLKKKDKNLEKQENIDIDISKYLTKNKTQSIEENQEIDNNEIFINRSKEFNFEEFINQQALRNNQINVLDVSDLDINFIPININMLAEVKKLNISNNNISVLQDELFTLNKLEDLDISDNKVNYINSNIQNLQNLKTLKIYSNASLNISPQIFKLKNLKEIIVDQNIIDMNIEIFQKLVNDYIKIVDQNAKDLTEYIEKYNLENLIKCTVCDEEKERTSFESSRLHKKTNYTTGICRDCVKKDKNKRDKDLVPIIRERYRNLKQKAKKSNKELNFDVAKLIIRFQDDNTLKRLYSEWIASEIEGERDKDLKPNFCLINEDSIDFSLENIKITTTAELNKINEQKISNIYSKPTIQFTLGNEPVQIYKSTQEVTKQLGIANGHVCNSCNKNSQAEGYIFQYLENIKDTSIHEKLNKIEKVNQCYVDDEDFLFELANNKELEDYLKVILYFKNYENEELQELIQETLLSNTKGYLLELFKKDLLELIEELSNNYSKIESEYFNYLYGFVNIRYKETENLPILEILKIIAKNTKSKQLIEFLMENKTKEEILLAIIENKNLPIDLDYIEERIINKYYLNSNYLELANKILQMEEVETPIIKKVIARVGDEPVKKTLLSMTYLKNSTNKWISNRYESKKESNSNIKLSEKKYIESKKDDNILKELLVELRNSKISKKFVINDRCILSDSRIEQFLIYKPLNKEEFRNSKVNKDIDEKQLTYLDDIFEIFEMADE